MSQEFDVSAIFDKYLSSVDFSKLRERITEYVHSLSKREDSEANSAFRSELLRKIVFLADLHKSFPKSLEDQKYIYVKNSYQEAITAFMVGAIVWSDGNSFIENFKGAEQALHLAGVDATINTKEVVDLAFTLMGGRLAEVLEPSALTMVFTELLAGDAQEEADDNEETESEELPSKDYDDLEEGASS